MTTELTWLSGGTITDTGIQYRQNELMHSDDFYDDVINWVDSYYEDQNKGLQNIYNKGEMTKEDIDNIILYL